MNIACIGEVMIELSLSRENNTARVGVAGDTFNTAVYLKRCLKNSHEVSYVTVLGNDSFSDQIVDRIAEENLKTQHIVRTDDRIPGLYAINTDKDGERSFTYWRDQASARLLFDEASGSSVNQLDSFDLIYYSAITLAILPLPVKDQFLSYLAEFRAKPGKQVAFDSNYRPKLWASVEEAQQYTTQAWENCDIALPSVDDEMALFGDKNESDVISRLKKCGVNRGALKCGEQGPLNLSLESPNQSNNKNTFQIVKNVVDTTAAGDSFNGGFLASLMDGDDDSDALIAGHQCASYVVQHPGAIVKLAP